MAAFKLALVLLVFSAGPTIAVIRAVEHRHPATYAHIAHNRQTLCRPRPLYSSPKSDLPASIATNGTAVQAEPLPDYTTATNADADAGVESHIPTAAIATTALDPDHVPSSLPSASSSSRLPKAKTTTLLNISHWMELTELPTHIKGAWQVTASRWPNRENKLDHAPSIHCHCLTRSPTHPFIQHPSTDWGSIYLPRTQSNGAKVWVILFNLQGIRVVRMSWINDSPVGHQFWRATPLWASVALNRTYRT